MARTMRDSSIQKKKEELWKTLQEQDVDTVKDILCHGVKVNCVLTDNLITPLHHSAKVGDEKLFKWLLSKGARMQKRDRWMDTVLHYACKYNQVLIVEVIVSVLKKENMLRECLQIQGKDRCTPITWVVKNGNFDLFKHIVHSNELKNATEFRTQVMKSIISNASEKDQITFMDILCGSDKMPLFKEISKREVDQFKYAEFYNVMQNIVQSFSQEDKEKCVEYVASTGSASVLKILLENPIGYSVKSIKSSVSVAIEKKHFKIAEMLINSGPDVEYEETHVILCIEKGKSHLLNKMLTVTRTFPFWSEASLQRMLYTAVMEGSEESVQIIVNILGTDFVKSCLKALDLALKRKSLHLYKYFKDKGLKLSEKIEVDCPVNYGIRYQHPMVFVAETGQLEFVNMLISDNVVPESKEDKVEVLKTLVKKQYEDIIDVLLPLMEGGILNNDVDICIKAIMTKNVNFVKMLMRRGLKLDVELKTESAVKTPLHAAVQTGVFEMVELCCQADAVITKRGFEIQEAIMLNCLDILQLLLKYWGKAVFQHIVQDKHEWSPLHEAIKKENRKAVEIILDCDSLVDIISQVLQESGTSLVYIALEKNNRNLMKLLLEYGAELNEPDLSKKCSSPNCYHRKGIFDLLLCASEHADPSVVSLLIKQGVKICAEVLKKFCNKTENTNIEFWKEIVSAVSESDSMDHLSDILYEACCANNVGFVQALLQNEAINFDDSILEHCVYDSLSKANIEVLKLLLKVPNVKVNEMCFVKDDDCKETASVSQYGKDIKPIHIAAQKSTELCEVLLSNGADINVSTDKGILPIHIAIMNQDTELLTFFLQHQESLASIILENEFEGFVSNSSLLHMAVKLQDIDTVKLLLNKSGPSLVSAADSDSKTPLFYICGWRDVGYATIEGTVQDFIDAGADINNLDNDGNSVLATAFQENNTSLILVLLKCGVRESIVQTLRWNDVERYIQNGQYDVIKALLSKGYNLTLQMKENNFNMKDLVYNFRYLKSKRSGIVAMMKCMLENGAQLNNYIGVEDCVRNNWLEMAQVLIDLRAEVNDFAITRSFSTHHLSSALNVALQKGYFEMAKLLLDAGATFSSSKVIMQLIKSTDDDFPLGDALDKYKSSKTAVLSTNKKTVCEIIDKLISQGAEVNVVDKNDLTTLHLATEANLVWFVEKLLQAGCNVDTRSGKKAKYPKLTALQIACKLGHFEIAQMLMHHGASCEFSCAGMTLLHSITKKQSRKVVSVEMTQNSPVTIEPSMDIEYSDDGTGFKCFNLQESASEEAMLLHQLVNKGVDVNAVSAEGWTALHYAVNNGDLALTKMLVALQCNMEQTTIPICQRGVEFQHCKPIQIAAKKGFLDIVNFLLERGCDAKIIDTNGKSVLQDVIENCRGPKEQYYSCVEKIKESGIDLNTKDNYGKTALNCAVIQNDHAMVKLLLTGHQVDLTSENHSSLLLAAEGDKLEIMKLLIEHGANVDLSDAYGDTALHHLCMKKYSINSKSFPNYREAMRLLMSLVIDINVQNKRNETPVQTACKRGNLEALKILLQHRKNVRLSNKVGRSYINLLPSYGNETYVMARLLLKSMNKQSLDQCLSKTLIFIINKSSTCSDIVKLLLRMGANPNHKTKNDNTMLHFVCKSGTIEILRLLLSFNANMNFKNKKNETPLHMACSSSNVEAMKALLKCGAKTDVQDIDGWTPLHICVHKSNREGVQLLIKSKANLDVETSSYFEGIRKGSTPLAICLDSKVNYNRQTAKLLIENGANPNVTDRNGNNILLVAVTGGYEFSYVEFLGQQQLPDTNHQNNNGWTALHHAVTRRSIDIVNFLLKHNCDVNIQINDKDIQHCGETALHMAFKMCHLELIELLLQNGADIFLNDKTGKSPSQCCFGTSQMFTVDTIKCAVLAMKAGCLINRIDGKKYFAVTKDREQLTDMLIQSGCKIIFNEPGLENKELDEIESIVNKQQEPLSLMRLAGNVVRTNVRPNALHSAKHLPLPESIIKFVTFENDCVEVQARSGDTMSELERHFLSQLILSNASNFYGLPSIFDYTHCYDYDDDDEDDYYYL